MVQRSAFGVMAFLPILLFHFFSSLFAVLFGSCKIFFFSGYFFGLAAEGVIVLAGLVKRVGAYGDDAIVVVEGHCIADVAVAVGVNVDD